MRKLRLDDDLCLFGCLFNPPILVFVSSELIETRLLLSETVSSALRHESPTLLIRDE